MDKLSSLYPIMLIEAAVLCVMISVIAYLAVRRFRSRLRRAEDRFGQACSSAKRIGGFELLKRQLKATGVRLKSQAVKVHPAMTRVWQLRRFYLRAELEALQSEEGSAAYWEELERRLMTIVSASMGMAQGESGKASARESTESITAADPPVVDTRPEATAADEVDLLKIIDRQRELIDFLRMRLQSVSNEDVGLADGNARISVDKLGENILVIDSLRKQSEEQLLGLKRRMGVLQNRRRSQEQDDDLRIFSIHGDKKNPDNDEEAKASQQEIQELRKTIDYQKETLDSFTSELSRLRTELMRSVSTEEWDKEQDRLSKLQRLLMETEGCVLILESEVDLLREQLSELSVVYPPEGEGVQDEGNQDAAEQAPAIPVAELRSELEQLQALLDLSMATQGVMSTFLKFAAEAGHCRELQSLGREVLKTLSNLGVDAALLLRGSGEVVELFDKSAFSAKERQTLKEVFTNTAEGIEEKTLETGLAIATSKVGLFMKVAASGDIQMKSSRAENLYVFINLISVFVDKINHLESFQRQVKVRKGIVKKVSGTLKELEVQYRYQANEANSVVTLMLRQLDDALQALTMTERQKGVINGLIEEFRARASLLFRSGLAVEKVIQQVSEDLKQDQ